MIADELSYFNEPQTTGRSERALMIAVVNRAIQDTRSPDANERDNAVGFLTGRFPGAWGMTAKEMMVEHCGLAPTLWEKCLARAMNRRAKSKYRK